MIRNFDSNSNSLNLNFQNPNLQTQSSDYSISKTLLDSFYLRQLMDAGVHYGHRTRYWNPKMKDFIYTEKNGIHILDLLKTISCLQKACQYAFQASKNEKTFLIVGTKFQISKLVASQAEKSRCFYINQRWLGGMLTNWPTMKTRIKKLNDLTDRYQTDQFQSLPKKEAAQLIHELTVLEKNLGGVRSMTDLPDNVIIIDQIRESLAVSECRKLNIPIISLVDTNCNPEIVDYPIPANDDALSSIHFILEKLTDSILAGKSYSEK